MKARSWAGTGDRKEEGTPCAHLPPREFPTWNVLLEQHAQKKAALGSGVKSRVSQKVSTLSLLRTQEEGFADGFTGLEMFGQKVGRQRMTML